MTGGGYSFVCLQDKGDYSREGVKRPSQPGHYHVLAALSPRSGDAAGDAEGARLGGGHVGYAYVGPSLHPSPVRQSRQEYFGPLVLSCINTKFSEASIMFFSLFVRVYAITVAIFQGL